MKLSHIAIITPLLLLSGCSLLIEQVYYEHQAPVFEQPTGPIARIDNKYRQADVGETVNFDAQNSYDIDGNNITYQWQLIEKPDNSNTSLNQTTGVSSRLTIDVPGTYRTQLIVNNGISDSPPFIATVSTEADKLPSVNIIVIGDAGTGSDRQHAVGNAINQLCQQKTCNFALGLGDNIYSNGVESVDDNEFKKKFEQPYKSVNLPFYMVLGNHDNSGLFNGDGTYNQRGELQIAYSRESTKKLDSAEGRERRDTQLNKWQMPSRYYEIPAPVADLNNQPLVTLLAIDSTLLTNVATNPDKSDKRVLKLVNASDDQAEWISATLHNSTAQWQLAFAHHPFLSNGPHGNAGNYDNGSIVNGNFFGRMLTGEYYRKFVEKNLCGKVSLFMNGHDHSMQLLNPIERCKNTRFMVSGAGAKTSKIMPYSSNATTWQAAEDPGFFYLSIKNNTMKIEAYTVNDEGVLTLEHEETVVQ